MPKVRFCVGDVETVMEAPSGNTLFQVGWKQDLGLQSACVGKGTCGLCRVTIVSGDSNLSGYNAVEEKHLGNLYHLTKLRLSCQCEVLDGDEEIVVKIRRKKLSKRDR